MGKAVTVAVDAMGGDHAPSEIVKGCVDAVKKDCSIKIVLVGLEDKIREELAKYPDLPQDNFRVVHASEVIETAEAPVAAIRKKKDSSIVVGLKLVKNKEVDAFVSAGSSGAIMVGGQLIVGRIRGIERPPFGAIIPTAKGVSLLLDCGANVDARSSHLVQFAQIGSIYMRDVVGIKDPSVGIINIGAEEDKGNALVKETFPLLKACKDIRFIGSVEARDIPEGGCDVLVAEGFAGNIVLKMYEGTSSMLLRVIKSSMMSSLKSKIGALLIKGTLKDTLKTYDATKYGGAPVLGLNALVVKTHGSAKAGEVCNSIFQCQQFAEKEIAEKIKAMLPVKEKDA